MTADGIPFSPAAERNSEPIAKRLVPLMQAVETVLEIGSGSGQHAVYLGKRLPHLTWQPSDLRENLQGIEQRLGQAGLPNVLPPLYIDVDQRPWPVQQTGAVFSANTLHIMSWSSVESMVEEVSRVLESKGLLCLYGPFRYREAHTSESNAQFDVSLRARDPRSGIRDFEAVCELAQRHSLVSETDYGMPANNRLLVFRKQA